eukprot:GGOE01009919.1.p1 GENE.GGOE01009919.1~~GGOE01009919.1.p1  ORF type:complete len:544 (-),score=129.64 GGOE01009919.1:498-2129(-)
MRQVFIEEEEKGDDYISRFGQHETWNDLYRMEDWQPHKMEEVELSEAVQRAHLSAFFADQYGLRYPVSPLLALDATMAMIRGSIQQLSAGSLWYRLQLGLKVRIVMRRFLQRKIEGRGPRESRERLLDGWLQYWREAEAKAWAAHRGHVNLSTAQRAAFGAPGAPPPSSAASLALVPDSVKARVLWELYWLLHAQTLRERSLYWTRWWALLRKRQKLRSQVSSLHQLRNYVDETTDFLGNDPVSLRAINATLFVMALQVPHFRYRAGEEVTLKLLLLLANAPQQVFHVNDPDAWVRPTSGVVDAFLDSSLCTDPTWLRARLNLSVPVIPLRTWRVDLLHVPRCTSFCSSEVPTEGSDEWQLLQLLEEPSSPGLLRAPTTSSYRTPTLCNSQSPRGLLRRLPSQLQLPSSRSSSFSRQRTLSVETNHSCSSPSRGSMLSRLGSFTNLQQTQGSPRQAPIFARLSSSILESPKPVMKLQSSTLSAGHATPRQITPRHTTPRLSAVPNEVELRRKASGLIRRRSFTQSADSTPSTAKVCSLPPLRN